MNRMPTRRASKGRRAAWLLIPLLVLASASRPICWCSGDGHGHCTDGGQEELVAACHGHEEAGEAHAQGTEHSPSEPCSPGPDCCCVEPGNPLGQAPESSTLDEHLVASLVAIPLARVLTVSAKVRAGAVAPRLPRGHSPPLYVVNCTFRC